MRFLIIGVGAIGGYLTTKLALSGNTVEALVSKRSDKRQIESEGIEYFHKDKKYVVKIPCYVYEDAKDLEADYLIVATKSQDAIRILDEIKEKRFSFNYLVTVQNGVEVHLKASEIYGEDHLILSVREGLYAFDVHKIRNLTDGKIENVVTSFKASRESVEEFAQILNRSEIDSVTSFEPKEVVYEKFLLNCIINPICSVLRVRNGYMMRLLGSKVVSNLINEAVKVLSLEGIDLNPNKLVEDLKKVVKATQENKCSMLQDLEKKRKTEIEFLNGYLIRLANKHKVEIPSHQLLYEFIVKMEELYGTH